MIYFLLKHGLSRPSKGAPSCTVVLAWSFKPWGWCNNQRDYQQWFFSYFSQVDEDDNEEFDHHIKRVRDHSLAWAKACSVCRMTDHDIRRCKLYLKMDNITNHRKTYFLENTWSIISIVLVGWSHRCLDIRSWVTSSNWTTPRGSRKTGEKRSGFTQLWGLCLPVHVEYFEEGKDGYWQQRLFG